MPTRHLSVLPAAVREPAVAPPALSMLQVQQANPGQPPLGQYLDIPVLTDWRSTDSVSKMRDIMVTHERGMFTMSALLVDEMLADDRIRGVLDTRIGGILAAPMVFTPGDERRKSQKLAKMLDEDGLWKQMVDYDTAYDLLKWKIMLGFVVAEKIWTTKDGRWVPRLKVYHPRHCWWNWGPRVFQLSTSGLDPHTPLEQQHKIQNSDGYLIDLPRVDVEVKNDSRWFVWGRQYSWMNGAIRSLAMKFLDRQWCERDWARYCEKHGMAIIEGKVPSGTDDGEKDRYLADLQNLGNETTIITPQASNGMPSYGVQLHEATAQTWQTFKARKESLDADIAIQLLGQNLTTEVKGGSFSAAQIHEGIRIDKKRQDAELYEALRTQLLVPWAEYNYGEGGQIAPYPQPQIEPPEDDEAIANGYKLLGEGVQALKLASPRVDEDTMLEERGIPMLEEDDPRAQPPPPMPGLPPPSLPPKPGAPGGEGTAPGAPGVEPGEGDEGEQGGETAARASLSAGLPTLAEAAYLARNFKPGGTGAAAHKRVRRFQDVMAQRAAKRMAQVLAPTLEMIRDDLEAVAKLEVPDEEKLRELKRRVIRRFPGMPVGPLGEMVRRLNIYWHLMGRDSVVRGG